MTQQSTNLARRGFLLSAGALGAGAVLAGCTSNSDSKTAATPAPAANVGTSGGNDKKGKAITIGFSAPAADHGWIGAITANAKGQAAKYSGRHPRGRRGHQRRQPADQPGRDADQQEGRRHRDPAVRREGADPGRDQGDGRRHPGGQPRPGLRQPAGRARLDRWRQLRHGRRCRSVHRGPDEGKGHQQAGHRRDRRASTTCRSRRTAARVSPTRSRRPASR